MIGKHETKKFKINTKYFTQNGYGITKEIEEISAEVEVFQSEGDTYYTWKNYNIIQYIPKKGVVWSDYYDENYTTKEKKFVEAENFTYKLNEDVDNYVDEVGKIESIKSFPKNMDGFRFYLNIIDLHMWPVYRDFVLKETGKIEGDIINKPSSKKYINLREKKVNLLDWKNITSDLTMEAGNITVEYVGNDVSNGNSKIYYFDQNQIFSQKVYGKSMGIKFKMPMKQTTRFLGHIKFDNNYELIKGNFNEYVYGKVFAPMGIKVYTITKREYSIERIE